MIPFLKLWVTTSVIFSIILTAIGETLEEVAEEEEEVYYNATYSDTGCLFDRENTGLTSADSKDFTFPENSIFFIETSCRGGLNFRQACSVETAARAHPNLQINVLFAGRSTSQNNATQRFLKTLRRYRNIRFHKIHFTEYAKDTPLEEIVNKDLKKSKYLMHHASDVLRFLTLYKFGGIYLDLDVFVVKPLDYLPVTKNWIGRDSDIGLAVGLMALSKTGIGKEIIDGVLTNLKANFSTKVWGANGINVITKSIRKVCGSDWRKIIPDSCRGFKIYKPQYFYPIKSNDYELFLVPLNGTLNLINVFAFHTWNYLIHGEEIPEDSLHAILTRKYCPNIDKSNKKSFGSDNSDSSAPKSRKIRAIRVQRSKVNTLYENIEINLKEKQLKKTLEARKVLSSPLSPRNSFHHPHRNIGKPLSGKISPHYHAKHYAPLRFVLRKLTRSTKR